LDHGQCLLQASYVAPVCSRSYRLLHANGGQHQEFDADPPPRPSGGESGGGSSRGRAAWWRRSSVRRQSSGEGATMAVVGRCASQGGDEARAPFWASPRRVGRRLAIRGWGGGTAGALVGRRARWTATAAADMREGKGLEDAGRRRREQDARERGPGFRERTLMSPRGGVNRRDDQIKLFLPKHLS
jgi:hypothetical protein